MNFEDLTKSNINFYFNNIIKEDIENFVDILVKYMNNNIIIIGIGKSQNAGLQFCDLLRCINFKSLLLEPSKMLHGDIGFIRDDDLIILISNSGNTSELIDISDNLKNNKIVLLSSKKGKLTDISHKNFIIPVERELDTCFKTIPTNSYLNFIIYFNEVISLVIDKLKLDKDVYMENHKSGHISFLFKNILDLVINPNKCSILKPDNTIKDLIISMNRVRIGISVIMNDNIIVGIVTDKDLRTYLEKNSNLLITVDSIMTKDFTYIDKNILIKDLEYKCIFIPVIINKNFYGIYVNKNN
jgi:arabinose-5-phosphate isomerase